MWKWFKGMFARQHLITTDYHTHHARCGHATGSIEDYIKAALQKGLTEIGISDHCPIYWKEGDDPIPTVAMAKSELEGYVQEILTLKDKYAGQIEVRLGLECDYVEGMEDFYRTLLAKYPFDYLIGSVHFVFDQNVYNNGRWHKVTDVMREYREYYRLVEKSAQSGLFDIIAHTTAILAYAPKPYPQEVESLQDQALAVIAQTGACVEINTSGYRKMTTDPFPTVRMIAKAHELGIPFTFSSDAHHPEQVGYHRDVVAQIFEKHEIRQLATFKGRERTMITLSAETVRII